METLLLLACCALFFSTSHAQTELKGYDRANMDTTVCPGENFALYATGNFLKNHPLRDDQMTNGAFYDLYEQNQKRIQELILQYSTSAQKLGTVEYKIGTLYNQMMDSTRRNKEGYQPIMATLQKIRNVKTREEYQRVTAEVDRRGENTMMFAWGVTADQRISTKNIVEIYQGGMGLGNRDYYLSEDEQMKKVREAYKAYGRKLFTMIGYSEADAQQKMEAAYAIEKRIAEQSYSKVELRDVEANYHKMSLQELLKDYPGIDWQTAFEVSGFPKFDSINVCQPEPIHEVEKILAETSLEDLKSYAEARIVGGAASCLSMDFRKAYFDFFQVMTGKPEDDALWKLATNLVNGLLADAIGEMYCKKYFPESSKQRVVTMVDNLKMALAERIESAEWMSENTKVNALRKLGCITVKIGYPEKWRDYTNMKVDESLSLYENLANISEFFFQDLLKRKVGKPVDKSEWHMSPQTINAYYSPSSNEICFPAGILQAPFFDAASDEALNYGAIGAVIGHEMSHGFDDQGCQFDENGNQRNWWEDSDKYNFDCRTAVLQKHFGNIEVINGKKVNGEMTLGENIGDNGGLNIALQAMHNAGINNEIDGFNADQRFFFGWTRIWASNNREQYMEMLLAQDVHSPNIVRVNGALPHIDAWYKAFNINKNDKLYIPKSKRAHVW